MPKLEALDGLRAIPRTLAHPNFGTYVAGNSVSLVGTWMQRIGVGWLAWELTGSGALLGLVAFADLFPAVVVAPFGGAIADRADRRRLMIVAQTLVMGQAFALFALTATGLITPTLLVLLSLFNGVVIGFNQPARLALVPSLVPRADLPTAVAINSIVFNLARFVGPALAGVTIVTAGVAGVFAANGLSYLAFLLALTRIRPDWAPPEQRPGADRAPLLAVVREGVIYAVRHPGIGPMLLLHTALAITVRPFIELLPGFAADVFGRGAPGLATLGSTVGVGAVFGGLWLAQRGRAAGGTRLALASALLVVLSVLAFAATRNFVVAVLAVAVAGFGMVATGVATQTLIQITVTDAMRGRVLSLYGLIFRGGPAVGALAIGAASEWVGLQAPLAAGAALALLAWLPIWRRRERIGRHLGEDGP